MPLTPNLDESRRQWLADLYDANSGAVFKQCRRMLNSPEDAADAMHEVFIRAATSLSEAPDSAQARGWLTTTARNYCIDVIRRRERLGSAVTALAASPEPAGDTTETVEGRQFLQAILARLGDREREVLYRSAVEDLPVAEIARLFGISYLAAAQLLHRARKRALSVAARIAILLGLLRLGRALRRSAVVQRGQQVAAVVAIPTVIAVAVMSSALHQATPAAPKPAPRLAVTQVIPAPVVNIPARVNSPEPAPSPSPVIAGAATAPVVRPPVGAVSAVQASAIPKPVVLPTVSADPDKDHGKGRDRDDSAHKHQGNGQAKGRGH